MMKVRVIGTDEVKEFSLIDPDSGVDFVQDFVGNSGGFESFEYNDDDEAYEASAETAEWWERVLGEQQQVINRIAELKGEHGSDAVYEVLEGIADHDLEDDAGLINAALDDAFGGDMKYWMIHGPNKGDQLGTYAAETEEEALEMMAREAGYASKAEQDEALEESGEPVGQEEIEEITKDEFEAIDRLLAEGYHQQGQALDAYREAMEIGDTWMLNSICDGLGDWKGIHYPDFLQAIVNANAEPWPTFETDFEDEVATKAAWDRLQREQAAEDEGQYD